MSSEGENSLMCSEGIKNQSQKCCTMKKFTEILRNVEYHK